MRIFSISFALMVYDVIIFAVVSAVLLALYQGAGELSSYGIMLHSVVGGLFIFLSRFLWKIYRQIWRYGGIQCYIRLLWADTFAMCLYFGVDKIGRAHV